MLSVILIAEPTVKHSLIPKSKLPDHLLWMAQISNCSGFLRCQDKMVRKQAISPGDIGMEPKVSYIYVIVLFI